MTSKATLSLAEALLSTGNLSRNRHFDALDGIEGRTALKLARRIKALATVLSAPDCTFSVLRQGASYSIQWSTTTCRGESYFQKSELELLALVSPPHLSLLKQD